MTKTVLIIDDEEDVREITKLGLEMSVGWRVLTASSGKEGIKLALESNIDVILLDLMMPEMDGRKTLKAIKNESKLQSIPVILMTAKDEEILSTEDKSLGWAGIINKPFRPFAIAETINQLLKS